MTTRNRASYALAWALSITACGSDGGSEPRPGDGASGDGAADGADSDGTADGTPDQDGGLSGDVESCVGDAEAGDTETQRLLFAGPGVSVALVRHVSPDQLGTSGSIIWVVDVFAASVGGRSVCVHDAARLRAYNTHHNTEDRVTASDAGAMYTLTLPGLLLTRTESDTVSDSVPVALTRCTRLNDDTPCTIHAGP